MMNYLKLFVCLKLTLGFVVAASAQDLSPQAAELEPLPPALKESFTAYLLEGTNSAVIEMKRYWLPAREQDEFSRTIRARIRDLDRYFGQPEKVELIFERRLTDSLRIYYLMIGYEEGVIFTRFDMYAANEKVWIISYAIDSKMSAVIPGLIETIP